MPGMALNMGLGTSAVPGIAGGYGSAATPAAAGASPQGPTSISQKAFGITTGAPGMARTSGFALIGGGGFSLLALWFIWWSLPR